MFVKLQNSNIVKSNQLESTENTVITTQYHLIFVVRECLAQMRRGDHFVFEHPSNASSWSELCVQKLSSHSLVFSLSAAAQSAGNHEHKLEPSGAFSCSEKTAAHVEKEAPHVTNVGESNSTPSIVRQLSREGVKKRMEGRENRQGC